jgi:hypothetical protein
MHTVEAGPFLLYAFENQEEPEPKSDEQILAEARWKDGVHYFHLPQLDIDVKVPDADDPSSTVTALVKAVFGFHAALRDLPESHVTDVEEFQLLLIEEKFIAWFEDLGIQSMRDQADEPLRELVAG